MEGLPELYPVDDVRRLGDAAERGDVFGANLAVDAVNSTRLACSRASVERKRTNMVVVVR